MTLINNAPPTLVELDDELADFVLQYTKAGIATGQTLLLRIGASKDGYAKTQRDKVLRQVEMLQRLNGAVRKAREQ